MKWSSWRLHCTDSITQKPNSRLSDSLTILDIIILRWFSFWELSYDEVLQFTLWLSARPASTTPTSSLWFPRMTFSSLQRWRFSVAYTVRVGGESNSFFQSRRETDASVCFGLLYKLQIKTIHQTRRYISHAMDVAALAFCSTEIGLVEKLFLSLLQCIQPCRSVEWTTRRCLETETCGCEGTCTVYH